MKRHFVSSFFFSSKNFFLNPKLVVGFIALMLQTTSYAFTPCPFALPTDHVDFCPSFVTSAKCYCLEAGLPQSVCGDMDSLYRLMMLRYFSLSNACKHQQNVPVQECIDDWNCYRQGGKDSRGKLCSSSGKACRKKLLV